MAGAEIRVAGTNLQALTAGNGRFLIRRVPAGGYTVEIHALGFRTATRRVDVEPGGVAVVESELELRPMEVGTVEVHTLRPDLRHPALLGASRVREGNPQDAGEAMRGIPGVDAARRGPLGMEPVIRGLRETEVGTYMNGTRLFPAGPVRMDSPLTHLDPSGIQHVEVVKGPYALTWGAGNLAAIRVDTRAIPPQVRGALHGTLGTGYDTNLGAREYSGSAFGSGEDWAYWTHGVWRDGDDYESGDGRDVQGDFNSWETRGRVGYRTGETSWANVSAGYQEQGPLDYPGRLLDADYFETVELSAEWDLNRSEGLLRAANVVAYVNDIEHGMTNVGKPTREPMEGRAPPFALDVGVGSEVGVTGGRAGATLEPGPDWTVELGGDVYRARKEALRTIRRLDEGTLLFQDLMWPENTITDVGMWGRAERPIRAGVEVSATLRLDVVEVRADTASDFFLDNTTGGLDQSETNLSAAATLTANLNSNWNLSVGAGTAVRTADATERYSDRIPASRAQIAAEFLGDPDLAPERSTQADVWIEARYPRWSLDLNGFVRRVDDYVTVQETDLPKRLPLSPVTVYRFFNGEAEFWGFETSLGYSLTRRWTTSVGLEYLEGRDVSLDEPALGVAPPRGKLGVRFEDPDAGYFAEATLEAVGEQERLAVTRGEGVTSTGDVEPTPGYATVDLGAGYRFAAGLQLRAGVENLLDQQYHRHLNARNPFTGVPVPEPGRVLFLRATYSF